MLRTLLIISVILLPLPILEMQYKDSIVANDFIGVLARLGIEQPQGKGLLSAVAAMPKPSPVKEYFDKYVRAISNPPVISPLPNDLENLSNQYKNVIFPQAGIEMMKEYNSKKHLFPMLSFSATREY